MVLQRSGICVRSCDMIGGYVVPSNIQILAVCAKTASSAPRRDGVSGLLVALVVTNDCALDMVCIRTSCPPLRLMGSKLETAGRQGGDAGYPFFQGTDGLERSAVMCPDKLFPHFIDQF